MTAAFIAQLELSADQLETLAERAAMIAVSSLERRTTTGSPYLTTSEAAELLRCSRQRIHDLLSQSKLTRLKEGRRTLLLRNEVEALVEVDRVRRAS